MYSTVTAVKFIVKVQSRVGSIGSGIAATVLYILKKKGAAKAALWGRTRWILSKKEYVKILGYLIIIGITLLFFVIIKVCQSI